MNYQETLEYLYARLPVFHNIGAKAYKPGLEKSLEMMSYFDNPHRKYKSIHIAGTNGKGSVSHMLSAVLQTAGYRVGLYTSPHLVDFGERIRVNGKMIEESFVVEFVKKHFEFLETLQPSFFEATMAMSFDYFAQQNVDVAIIEVGLGGRLDSTNIISPELSVITNIGKDHIQFLGDDLASIAFEKAGIIKENTPVVIGEQNEETELVFRKIAQERNADIFFASDLQEVEFVVYEKDAMLVHANDVGELRSGLLGKYQLKNIATLLEAVVQLRKKAFKIEDNHLAEGLENVLELSGIQGRWQKLSDNPTLVLDTGHNVAGVSTVVHQLAEQEYNKLRIVIGLVDDKDIDSILQLLPKEAIYYFVAADTNRAIPSKELKMQAVSYQLFGDSYQTVAEGMNQAIKDANSDDFIFLGGSNYVVGDALIAYKNKK